jgi:hypothetical protein
MSNGSRIAVVLAAVVALVVAFAALRPSDEEPSPAPEVASTPAPETTATSTTEAAPPPSTATTPAEPEVPTVSYRDGKPVGGAKSLKFESGEDIVFRIRADVATEVHVHGYDKYVDTKPGEAVTVRIPKAELEGVFEVEDHANGNLMANLEVSPS